MQKELHTRIRAYRILTVPNPDFGWESAPVMPYIKSLCLAALRVGPPRWVVIECRKTYELSVKGFVLVAMHSGGLLRRIYIVCTQHKLHVQSNLLQWPPETKWQGIRQRGAMTLD